MFSAIKDEEGVLEGVEEEFGFWPLPPRKWTWITGMVGFWVFFIFCSRRSSSGELADRKRVGTSWNTSWFGSFSMVAMSSSCFNYMHVIRPSGKKKTFSWMNQVQTTYQCLHPSSKMLVAKKEMFWFIEGPVAKIWAIRDTALPAFMKLFYFYENFIFEYSSRQFVSWGSWGESAWDL